VPVVAKSACLSFLVRSGEQIERLDKIVLGDSKQLRCSSYEVDRIVQNSSRKNFKESTVKRHLLDS
jgi:hypothetical protein